MTTPNTTANEILAMVANLQEGLDAHSEVSIFLSILRDQILVKYQAAAPVVTETLPALDKILTNNFEAALFNFCKELQKMINDHYETKYPNLTPDAITLNHGSKYIRVVKGSKDSGRSVYCFIEKATGDILKAASWKAPAKTARGNIYNENVLKGCNPHGVDYLK